MREYVWLECTACGDRNYRVQKETRGRPARAEEILPARAEAYAAQGIAEEVTRTVRSSGRAASSAAASSV